VSILVPAQFREHQATSLGDPALQRLIDAAEGAITSRFGALGQFTERRRGGGLLLFLSRPAGTIASVTERYGDPVGMTDVLLDATDYTLLPDGQTLRREWTGTHKADRWTDDVIVVQTPADDTAERVRVAIALVKLDLTYNPGLTDERIGDWSESYNGSAMPYGLEREAILSTLLVGLGFA
jgi:hypothetical protein